MADVDLAVKTVGRNVTGVNFTDDKVAAIAANNYFFQNDGTVKLMVSTAEVGGSNLTIVTPNTVDGLAVADKVIALVQNKVYAIGPFPTSVYNDSATGKVKITVSANTDILAFRG